VKESPSLPRFERRGLRLTLPVVQSSDARWTAAPHRPHEPDWGSHLDRPTAGEPTVPPKDDIVGWPDELLNDYPDFPDRTLDSVANSPRLTQWDSCICKTRHSSLTGGSSLPSFINRMVSENACRFTRH